MNRKTIPSKIRKNITRSMKSLAHSFTSLLNQRKAISHKDHLQIRKKKVIYDLFQK